MNNQTQTKETKTNQISTNQEMAQEFAFNMIDEGSAKWKELFLKMQKDLEESKIREEQSKIREEQLRNKVKELENKVKELEKRNEAKSKEEDKKEPTSRKRSPNYLGTSEKISPAHKKLPLENCYRIEEWTRRTEKATSSGKCSAKELLKYAAGTVRTKITFYYTDNGEDIRFTSLGGIMGYLQKLGKNKWEPYGKKVPASHYIE